jgi:hypothetical protein
MDTTPCEVLGGGTTGNIGTSVGLWPTEVSSKPTEKAIFVSYGLTSVGLWRRQDAALASCG